MKTCTVLFLTLMLAAGMVPAGFAQSQPAAGQGEDTLTLGTSEVALDVVVRDKRGRPVRDLTTEDFEVYEDGVRQDVTSFRLVTRADRVAETAEPEAAAPEAAPAAQPAAPGVTPLTINTVALVFDRLSADARIRAREAAEVYVKENLNPDDFVGVFVTDLSLNVIQPYTNNRDRILQSLDVAGSHAGSLYKSTNEQVRTLAERNSELTRQLAQSAGAAAAGGASAGAAGQSAGTAGVEMKLNEMSMQSLEAFERLERDQQGFATTNGLLSIVDSMRRLPGRKAIIFFSEGMSIPPTVQTHFRAVISSANRANVSVYAVDAAGLRAESLTAETAAEMRAAANRRMRQLGTAADPTGPPMTRALERNEDLMRLNPHSGLGQLANETGGLLIANTNNIGARLRQVDEDLRTHYLLTYVPKDQDYDGQFREIAVRVRRSDLEVQARKGYYAVPNIGPFPVLPYEAPVLGFLGHGDLPTAIPLRAAGMSFLRAGQTGAAPVVVEVPAAAFTFTPDQAKKTFETDFSVVALVRNDAQQVVDKLSQNYRLTGPLDKMEETRKGEVLFYREPTLAPGRYFLEVAAYDAPTGKAGVHKSTFVVPPDDGKLRLSSLVLVKRIEPITNGSANAANPLQYGDTLLYPNLGEPVSKAAHQRLAFAVTAYPARGAAKPKLTIEVLQKGRALAQIPAELPPADAQGRVQFMNALPLEALAPGEYELKVTAADGQSSASRSARFELAP